MYSREHLNSKTNRFGLLFLLLLVVVVVIIAAFFAFKREGVPVNQATKKGGGTPAAESSLVLKTVNKNEEGFSFVTGRIVELVEIPGTQGKRIRLSVNNVDKLTQITPAASGEKPKEAKHSFKNFLFFLSERDTKGAKDIKGGDFVTVTFQGEPSEKDYMVASKVEVKK